MQLTDTRCTTSEGEEKKLHKTFFCVVGNLLLDPSPLDRSERM